MKPYAKRGGGLFGMVFYWCRLLFLQSICTDNKPKIIFLHDSILMFLISWMQRNPLQICQIILNLLGT